MRPPRLNGYSYAGPQRYFLTMCTHERRPHFTNPDLVADVRLQFLHTAKSMAFAIIAYCFMPDHLHVIAQGCGPDSDLRTLAATAKQRAAHVGRRWVRGRLWQPGYYDRILREDDDLIDVVRYVVQNPVRAGLVQSVLEYPFVGSEMFSTEDLVVSTGWRPR